MLGARGNRLSLRKGRKVYTLRPRVSLRVYFVSIQGLRRASRVDYGSIRVIFFDTFSTLLARPFTSVFSFADFFERVTRKVPCLEYFIIRNGYKCLA